MRDNEGKCNQIREEREILYCDDNYFVNRLGLKRRRKARNKYSLNQN